jgi:hypothetical protein
LPFRLLTHAAGAAISATILFESTGYLAPRGKKIAASIAFATMVVIGQAIVLFAFYKQWQRGHTFTDDDYRDLAQAAAWIVLGPFAFGSSLKSVDKMREHERAKALGWTP